MKAFKVTVQADNIQEMREELVALAEALGQKRGPGRPAGTTKPAQEAAPAAAPAEEDPFAGIGGEAQEAAPEKETTKEDVVKAIKAYIKLNKTEKAIKILAKLNVKSYEQLKPEQYAEAVAAFAV